MSANLKPLLSLRIASEHDVVLARQRARQIASGLGFEAQDQTRIATAVSEIARNAFEYARGGTVAFALESGKPPLLAITVRDSGAGIADLASVLEGRYRSSTGMGLGIVGARRLMDRFSIQSGAGGTVVSLGKSLPPQVLVGADIVARLSKELAQQSPQTLLDELQRQNQEMLRALDELRARQEQMAQMNRELEDTNRGVVALYAELDERADELRRANEVKTRFLSSMSHELRTPINAILGLARLLQTESDGELSPEQQKQVAFIRRSGETLGEIVNDLLDLAKVEAGKVSIRAASFHVDDLFGALRGMLKPLLADAPVQLIFEAWELPPLVTDEGKLSQILRNFISNAIKFTPRGEVRVEARLTDGDSIEFCVCDSGIGISAVDLERVWDEFSQVETPLQNRSRGTGLGLPLARKLAQLLGGTAWARSEVGAGSRFFVSIPRVYAGESEGEFVSGTTSDAPQVLEARGGDSTPSILIIDDDAVDRYLLRQMLGQILGQILGSHRVIEARDGSEGLRRAGEAGPRLIFLDLEMPGLSGPQVLEALREEPLTREIPVVIHTARQMDEAERRGFEGRALEVLGKERGPEQAEQLREVLRRVGLLA